MAGAVAGGAGGGEGVALAGGGGGAGGDVDDGEAVAVAADGHGGLGVGHHGVSLSGLLRSGGATPGAAEVWRPRPPRGLFSGGAGCGAGA
ncbi:hypothetical protein C0Q59_22500 [Streptomyces albidoflavus]|nr:hypothetical protein C0Q59_22500 [Streptomyces albidoflavus]